jgi:hypothetical protein
MFNILSLRSFCALLFVSCSALAASTDVANAQNQSSIRNGESVLQAGALAAHVDVQGHRFAGVHIHDELSDRIFDIPEAFVLVLKDKTQLRSTDMQVTAIADPTLDPHQSSRVEHGIVQAPVSSCWSFTAARLGEELQWCLIARPHSDYVRQLLRITATNKELPLAEVRMLEFVDSGAHVEGSVKGSPVVDNTMFLGMEHPLSINSVQNGKVSASILRELPLQAGQSITYSAVLGIAHPGQLRRAFLAYIESERPRPYAPFLHYNSWFDLGYGNRFDEAGALDRINAFGQQLTVQRHVKLDSFLFDDGWDDPHSLWGFNSGFPNGFTNAGTAAAKYGAGVGVWLSPWGGYDEEKKQRIAYGHAHGYEILNDGYALSGPKYFQQFQKTCLEMVDKYNVNQFKFDGTGNADRVFPGSAFDSDFDAAIHLIERLRQEKPSTFINLTTGTTASPFWLFYADSIWRGGADHDFSGVGSARQRWITYRDAQTYKNIVLQGPLFPLNSLMLHGVVYASKAKDLTNDPGNDFADEVHSYFGTGTQLQEMYITPSLLTPANWDTLAEAARWSRSHAATLKDTHWIGGDPDQLQVYGWAAWSPHEGILTLRNPSKKPQTFNVDVASIFELQPTDPSSYNVHNVWAHTKEGQQEPLQKLHAGQPFPIHLAPFEVITLEAIPTH